VGITAKKGMNPESTIAGENPHAVLTYARPGPRTRTNIGKRPGPARASGRGTDRDSRALTGTSLGRQREGRPHVAGKGKRSPAKWSPFRRSRARTRIKKHSRHCEPDVNDLEPRGGIAAPKTQHRNGNIINFPSGLRFTEEVINKNEKGPHQNVPRSSSLHEDESRRNTRGD